MPRITTMTDDPLLAAAVTGDKDALSTLLARHGATVRQAIASDINSQFRSVLDEDDVMQVTYLEAFLRIRDLRATEAAAFVGWLKQIARNNLQDAIKGLTAAKRPDPRRQAKAAQPEESAADLLELVGMDRTTASQVARRNERQSVLSEALRQLPADYAKVLKEYDLDGDPIEAVAKRMNRSTGAVFMLRARALARLKEILPSLSNLYGRSWA